jgi:hypothetical protein
MEIGNSVVADSTQPNLLSETVRAIDLNSTQNRRWFSASRVPSTPDLSLDSSVLPALGSHSHALGRLVRRLDESSLLPLIDQSQAIHTSDFGHHTRCTARRPEFVDFFRYPYSTGASPFPFGT